MLRLLVSYSPILLLTVLQSQPQCCEMILKTCFCEYQTFKPVLKDFRAKETHEEISTRSCLICRHHTHFASEWWSGLIWYVSHNITQRCSRFTHYACLCDGMTLYRKIWAFQYINKNMRRTWEEKKIQESWNGPWEKQMFPLPRL